jgi:hypothetical protein
MILPAGSSFARWCFFDYPAAIHLLNDPLPVSPNNGCGNPFRGASRLLKGTSRAEGAWQPALVGFGLRRSRASTRVI